MNGFTELRAPVYSKTLLGPDGKPALLGYAPVTFDRDCPTKLTMLVSPDYMRFFERSEEALDRRAGLYEPALGRREP